MWDAEKNLIDFRQCFESNVDQFFCTSVGEVRMGNKEMEKERVDGIDFRLFILFAIGLFPPVLFPTVGRNSVNVRIIVKRCQRVNSILIIVQGQSEDRMFSRGEKNNDRWDRLRKRKILQKIGDVFFPIHSTEDVDRVGLNEIFGFFRIARLGSTRVAAERRIRSRSFIMWSEHRCRFHVRFFLSFFDNL